MTAVLAPPNAGTDPLRPPARAALRAARGTQDLTDGLGFLLDDAVGHDSPTRADRAENGSDAR